MQVGHRHIELGALVVFDGEELGLLAVAADRGKAPVAADAVFDMNDGVVEMQFGQVPEHEIGMLLGRSPPAPLGDLVAEQHLLGDEYEAFFFEPQPPVDGRHGDADGGAGLDKILKMAEFPGHNANLAETLLQVLPAARALGAEQHPGATGFKKVRKRLHGGGEPRIHCHLGHLGQWPQAEHFPARFAHPNAWIALEAGEGFIDRQENLVRLENRPLQVVGPVPVAVGDFTPEGFPGAVDIADLHAQRVLRQIIEQGVELVEKQRQVILEPRRGEAVADVAVERALQR